MECFSHSILELTFNCYKGKVDNIEPKVALKRVLK